MKQPTSKQKGGEILGEEEKEGRKEEGQEEGEKEVGPLPK